MSDKKDESEERKGQLRKAWEALVGTSEGGPFDKAKKAMSGKTRKKKEEQYGL